MGGRIVALHDPVAVARQHLAHSRNQHRADRHLTPRCCRFRFGERECYMVPEGLEYVAESCSVTVNPEFVKRGFKVELVAMQDGLRKHVLQVDSKHDARFGDKKKRIFRSGTRLLWRNVSGTGAVQFTLSGYLRKRRSEVSPSPP